MVSTDCPGGPGEILEDGALATLTPVGDWQRPGEAMVQASQRPVNDRRLRAAVQRYTPERTVEACATPLGTGVRPLRAGMAKLLITARLEALIFGLLLATRTAFIFLASRADVCA